MPERNVVITGANRGLGLELARHFAKAGDRVWGTARKPAEAEDLRRFCAGVVPLDAASDASIAYLPTTLDGIGRVDLLINNAGLDARAFGVDRAEAGPLALDSESFLGEMRVNALGPMLITRALLPLLRSAPEPIVVNISSQLGSLEVGGQMPRDVGYNASKAALNMVTCNLAAELADQVTVVSVHPGWVRTDMGGPEAMLDIDESAAAIGSLIEGLGPADTGRFFRWDGEPHPW